MQIFFLAEMIFTPLRIDIITAQRSDFTALFIYTHLLFNNIHILVHVLFYFTVTDLARLRG